MNRAVRKFIIDILAAFHCQAQANLFRPFILEKFISKSISTVLSTLYVANGSIQKEKRFNGLC
jgi:hypothetical protein